MAYRLAALTSHAIQYQAPLFRRLAAHPKIDLTVYLCSDWGYRQYMDRGFGRAVQWDRPLLEGFRWKLLRNWSPLRAPDRPLGVFNPGIIPELARNRYDAIIIHGYALASYLLGFFASIVTRTPIFFRGETVVRPRRGRALSLVKASVLSLVRRSTSAFLAIGTPSIDFYQRLGIARDRIIFTPYAVDVEFFRAGALRHRARKDEVKSSFGIPRDLPVILFVGKLVDRKCPLDLLEAFAPLDDHAALLFVGDGDLRSRLERRVSELGLLHVRLAGFRNQSELPAFYGTADIFALPSSHEVSPLVINEAMSSELPIVASDAIPSVVDLVVEGSNGYRFPCRDVVALRERLRSLLSDVSARQAMGAESAHIISGWTHERSVQGVLDALERFSRKSCGVAGVA